MNYNILGNTAQALPRHEKGTKCIKLLLSQASKRHAGTPCSDVFPNVCDIFSASKK